MTQALWNEPEKVEESEEQIKSEPTGKAVSWNAESTGEAASWNNDSKKVAAETSTQGWFDELNHLLKNDPEAYDKITLGSIFKGRFASDEEKEALEKGMKGSGAMQDLLKHIGSQIYSLPLAGLSGLGEAPLSFFRQAASGEGFEGISGAKIAADMGKATEKMSTALTYQPDKEKSSALVEKAMYPFQKLSEYSKTAGDFYARKTGIPEIGAIVKSAGEALPIILGAKGAKSVGGQVVGKVRQKVFGLPETVKKYSLSERARVKAAEAKITRDINRMVGKNEKAISLANMASKFSQKAFDRFTHIKQYSQGAYEAASTHASYKDIAFYKMLELKKGLELVKNDEKMFQAYVLYSRSKTRAKNKIDNPGGVSLREADVNLRAYEAEWARRGNKVSDLKKARKNFHDWTHKYILKEGVESGVISKETYREIKDTNDFYAAFEILDMMPDKTNSLPLGGETFSSTNQNIFKKQTGTKKKLGTLPIEATTKKMLTAQALYARNKVANILIDDPVMTKHLVPVVKSAQQAKALTGKGILKLPDVQIAITRHAGLEPIIRNVRPSKVDQLIKDLKKVDPKIHIRKVPSKAPPEIASRTYEKVHVEGNPIPKDMDIISRFKDGKVEKFVVPKELATSMKQLTPWQAPRVLQMFNDIFRKSATTAYLPFTIGNAMRDAYMAYTTAPVHMAPHKFAKDWVKGFKESAQGEFLGKTDLAKEYVNAGGGFGYVGNIRHRSFAKDMLFKKGMIKKSSDIVKSPLTLIEKISATIEGAPRRGTFNRAVQKGYTPKQAALMARRSTLDFNRAGAWTKVLNQFIPFLNARVQARVTLADALGVPEYFKKAVTKGKHKIKPGTNKQAGQTLAKIGASVVVPGAMLYAWNRLKFSDYYDDIPEEIKKNYFVMITGVDYDRYDREVPQYIVIAKGDVGQMAWNPIEFGLDDMWEKDSETAGNFMLNYLSDVSPVDFVRDGKVSASKTIGGLIPPVIKGAVENTTNLNFWSGREVVPFYMGKKPPELQYDDFTPETYKKFAKMIARATDKKVRLSPKKLQNFAASILAGYGREGLDPSAMWRGLTGRLVKTKGGAKEHRVSIIIKDIEQGYIYARAEAEEMLNEGYRAEANALLNQWNQGLGEQIEKIQELGWQDQGGIRKSYMFTLRKRRSIMSRKRKDPRSYVQKKLQPRRR